MVFESEILTGLEIVDVSLLLHSDYVLSWHFSSCNLNYDLLDETIEILVQRSS